MKTYKVVTVWEFEYEVVTHSPEEAEELDESRGYQDWQDAVIIQHYIKDPEGGIFVPPGHKGPEK